jgi:hypothetical protein
MVEFGWPHARGHYRPLISVAWPWTPVRLAPGRLWLLTIPMPIGSPTVVKTTGMVAVAACAAVAVAVPKPATITSGNWLTHQASDAAGISSRWR